MRIYLADLLSPKGRVESNFDQNGTVIPSVPAAIANTNTEAAKITMAQLQAGGAKNVNESTLPTKNNAAMGNFGIR